MHTDPVVNVLLGLSIIILAAKIGALIADKFKQPLVLGELLAGVLVGNLYLVGFTQLDFLKSDHILEIFSSLGVIILLFEVGLESKLSEMLAVGMRSLLAAIAGVIAPFILGYYVSGILISDLSEISRVFIGAMLTATSVGITARVFKDLNFLQAKESRIVLGAAVIDDILGLIILAVVSSIATTGSLDIASISLISLKAVLFVVVSIILGLVLAKRTINLVAKRANVPGMMLSLILLICFMGAYFANQFGLASIVGAFCMGLILDEIYFKNFKSEKTVHDYIQPISLFLVPIFFIITGLHVDISVLRDPSVLGAASILCLVAIISKLICGYAFPKTDKNEKLKRLIIGVGMIPRGEVGLIFASVGKSIGVVDDKLYAIAVIVVIISTLITPPILAKLIKLKDGGGTK